MINTFYGSNTLASPGAFLAALFIGFVFGFALERAGFGSSRKLAGIFYFRDMTVLKVMFSGPHHRHVRTLLLDWSGIYLSREPLSHAN